jgi:N,N'-diacetylchitobiose phosphorylase
MKFYDALCPYHQNDLIEIREAEPYSYCQFIMGTEHTAHGRARHPFMTGSGGWSYFSTTRYMLGIRPGYDRLIIDPCVPAEWKAFSITRRWRGATYEIEVENPDGAMKGVKQIYLNGNAVHAIPAMAAGTVNKVRIVMGEN